MKMRGDNLKKEDITNIAVAVSDVHQGHWDTVHGRMEGMMQSLNTIISQYAAHATAIWLNLP